MQLEGNPETPDQEQADLVRAHLRDVLASDAFRGGKRAQDFLQLIVEHALAGRFDHLRERMLGAEMFGRPIAYDTGNDAVVRVKASEVRKRLAHYYRNLSGSTSVRIDLPSGSYVPQFYFDLPPLEEQAPSHSLDSDLPEPGPELRQVAQPSLSRSRSFRTAIPMVIFPVAGSVLLAAGFFAVQRSKPSNASHPIRSIAILPLANLSGDPSQQYFADGITEELTTELGQVASLRVTSRTSTMSYKDTKKTLPEIARELNVDGIVEGSVEREGNRVRITTQLIDSQTDQHIWAHSYDRDMTSVLELQSEVTRDIANQIRIELSHEEQAHLTRVRPVNPDTEDLYLRGKERFYAGDQKTAFTYIKKAVLSDPNYAPAHAALAQCFGWLGNSGLMPRSEGFTQQYAEARKAVELDDSLPQAHIELGYVAMSQGWNWDTQGREFIRAVQLNASLAVAHEAYSDYLLRLGRISEAIAETELTIQLDPVSPHPRAVDGYDYYIAHQYNQALNEINHAVALHAGSEIMNTLALVHIQQGMYSQAIQEFQKLDNNPVYVIGHVGTAYARMGHQTEARTSIARLEKYVETTGAGRYEIALVYVGLKENDKAFEWLEKAYQTNDTSLTYLKIDPLLDPLRSDPRFQSLLRQVGLPL